MTILTQIIIMYGTIGNYIDDYIDTVNHNVWISR